jgi:hypothetical protein
MFSHGEYSDYCVGGMYKSTQELSEEWFAQYLKSKMIEQVPEAGEFFLGMETTLPALTGYTVPEKLYLYCTQDEEVVRRPNLRYDNKDIMWLGYQALCDERYKRKDAWLKSKGFTQEFVKLLVQDGVLQEVEYDEIWNG